MKYLLAALILIPSIAVADWETDRKLQQIIDNQEKLIKLEEEKQSDEYWDRFEEKRRREQREEQERTDRDFESLMRAKRGKYSDKD